MHRRAIGALAIAGVLLATLLVPRADAAGKRILFIGDSLTDQSSASIAREVTRRGDVADIRAIGGTGLVTQRREWLREMGRAIDQFDPHVVVVEFVGNHIAPWPKDDRGEVIRPATPAFFAAWTRTANDAMAILTRRGAQVHWVLGPPMDNPALGHWRDINLVYLGLRNGWPNVRYIDWSAALTAADGRYTETLDGERIRHEDRVHLTEAGNRRAASLTASVLTLDVQRVAGGDRIDTAIALSRQRMATAETVVLATSADFADALAGAPLAAIRRAPLLLTGNGALHPSTAAEIRRLGARRAVLLGGERALGNGVVGQLGAMGLSIERIAGGDRFDTAARIAALVGGEGAYIAKGQDADPSKAFADALSVSALAAHMRRPILLTSGFTLPQPTANALRGRQTATIVGGITAVPPTVEAQVRTIVPFSDRLGGDDRYATARLVAERSLISGMRATRPLVATGRDWADALVAGPLAGGQVLVLVDGGSLRSSPATRDFLRTLPGRPEGATLLGGTSALTHRVAAEVAQALDR